jgi:hypothetical protein
MNSKPVLSVAFNDPEEFLQELREDCHLVDRRILRVTVRRRYGEPFVTVSVLATAAIEGTVVKLDHRVGESFMGEERTNGVAKKTQMLLDQLSEAGKSLGLEIRAGTYE